MSRLNDGPRVGAECEARGRLGFREHRGTPLTYLPSVDLLQFVSYLEGFDRACGGGALLGFREWVLVVRGGHPERAWWSNLLEAELSISDERELHDETAHLDAIRRIVSQFIEFRRFVAAPDGWTKLFRDYDMSAADPADRSRSGMKTT